MTQRVFLLYAAEDEALRDELERQLASLRRSGAAVIWHDRQMLAGEDATASIEQQIDAADVILLLVTPDFLASDKLQDEQVTRALDRRRTSCARVVPVIVRPCLWEVGALAHFEPLPQSRQPVTSWLNRDEAWRDVVRGVLALLSNEVAPPVVKNEGRALEDQLTAAHSRKDMVVSERPKLANCDLVDGLPLHEPTGDKLPDGEPRDDEASDVEPTDERDLAALRAEAETILGKSREITERLAQMGYTSPGVTGAKGVALKLVNSPARQVAKDLAKLARTTVKGPQQEHLQDLLWHLLPLVVNWVDVPARARDAVESGDAVELPLKTETIAEIALARDEGRRCFFAPVDKEPQGMSHIPLPASAHTVYFDSDGQRLAQAVLNNLWEEGRPAKRRLANADFWQDIRKDSTSWESFVIRARIEIEAGMDGYARFYLLLIDAKLDPQNNKDRETSWNVARDALCEAIPGLRIVRLKGGLAEEAVEYELVPHIRSVRDWK